MDFSTNTGGVSVLFGAGKLADEDGIAAIRKTLADRGVTRALIVTTEGSNRRNGDLVRNTLGPLLASTWIFAQPKIDQTNVDALLRSVTEHDADCVVALGGGSVTGICKIAALTHARAELDDTAPDLLVIAAIPTTFSGSEMTNIWGLHKDGHKVSTCTVL